MSERDGQCSNCGEPADGRHSIPYDQNGEIAPASAKNWVARPACQACAELYNVTGVDAESVVLEVYAHAIGDLHRRLELYRKLCRSLTDAIIATRDADSVSL